MDKIDQAELAVLAKTGDEAAKSALIKINTRFVASIARQYQNQGMDLDDLMQEGYIGLLRAIEKFDPGLGTKFLTYASWWVKQSILQSLSEHNRHIRLPANRVNILEQVKKTKSKLSQELQRDPTEQEVMSDMNVSSEEVYYQHSISYHCPIKQEDNSSTIILDTIVNSNIPSPDSKLLQEAFKQELNITLNLLEEREVKILKMLYGIDHERSYTLEEVGETLDLTRERIRQIKFRALKTLRRLNRRKRLDNLKD
jgi:RNA polymerase primary sigma factor